MDKTNETGRQKCVKANQVSKNKAKLGTGVKGRRRGIWVLKVLKEVTGSLKYVESG